jgi:hypothetical protein
MNGVRVLILALLLSRCQAETFPVLRGRLAYSLCMLGRLRDAEQAARRASKSTIPTAVRTLCWAAFSPAAPWLARSKKCLRRSASWLDFSEIKRSWP